LLFKVADDCCHQVVRRRDRLEEARLVLVQDRLVDAGLVGAHERSQVRWRSDAATPGNAVRWAVHLRCNLSAQNRVGVGVHDRIVSVGCVGIVDPVDALAVGVRVVDHVK